MAAGTPGTFASASAGSDTDIIAESQVTSLVTDLAAKAPLASPGLTGSPTAPTQTAGDNSSKIATSAFVATAVAIAPYVPTDIAGLDPTGATDDTTAINAALAAGGYQGTVVHPAPGIYKVLAAITPATNTRWFGPWAGLHTGPNDYTDGACLNWGSATGLVIIEGFLSSAGASSAIVATLPAGYRPTAHMFGPCAVGSPNVLGGWDITATGVLSVYIASTGAVPSANAGFTISYYAEQ